MAGIRNDGASLGVEASTTRGDESTASATGYGAVEISKQGRRIAVCLVGKAAKNRSDEHCCVKSFAAHVSDDNEKGAIIEGNGAIKVSTTSCAGR
jgi:hypothetical protein